MSRRERLVQQWVVQQVDLAYRQVIRRTPPRIDGMEPFRFEGVMIGECGVVFDGHVVSRLFPKDSRPRTAKPMPILTVRKQECRCGGVFRVGQARGRGFARFYRDDSA